LTKLARVRVDLSNRFDHLWKLDIKKSTTSPPEALRDGLRQIIGRITEGSRNVFIFKGKKASDSKITHAWDRTIVRDGVSYRINRDHPLLLALAAVTSSAQDNLLEQAFALLERSVPLDAIYLDKASHVQPIIEIEEDNYKSLESLAVQIVSSLGRETEAAKRFLDSLNTVEPFNAHPELARQIAIRLTHE
jgi:hypothetical protein